MSAPLTLQIGDAKPLDDAFEQIGLLLPSLPELLANELLDVALRLLDRIALHILVAARSAATGASDDVIGLRIGRLVEFVAAATAAFERDLVHGVALVVKSWSGDLDSTAGVAPPTSDARTDALLGQEGPAPANDEVGKAA